MSHLSDRRPLAGVLLVLAASFCFSAKAVLIKLAYQYGAQVSPLMLLALRMVLSLPFFLLAIFLLERRGTHDRLSMRDMAHLVGLGIVGFYLAAYLDFVGLRYITASLERLVLLLYPTLVVLISALIFRRPIQRREAIALIVSYFGIVVVFAEELSVSGDNVALGAALIFGSATAYAVYLIGCGVMVKRLGSMRFTAYAMTIACVATLAHFVYQFDATVLHLPNPVYGLALLMAIISTVIPTFLMNAGIQRLGANPASIISALGPVMTIVLAYLFLGEQLTAIQFIGAVLVMLGAFVVSAKS